jgi:hypothetical protein
MPRSDSLSHHSFIYAAINPSLAPWRNFLLSAEGLAVIIVQLALMPVFSHLPRGRIHALVALAAGTGLILSFSENLSVVFTGLAVFAMAECLAMPLAQLEISERVPSQYRRNIFALGMVAAAFGEIARLLDCLGGDALREQPLLRHRVPAF